VTALVCAASLLAPALCEGVSKRRGAREGRVVGKPSRGPAAPASKAARRAPGRPAASAPAHGTRGVAEEHVHIRRGDTLETVLTARGLSSKEAGPWLAAAGTVYDLRKLQPRRGLSLRFDRATHALEAIHYEIDDRALLVLERTPRGVHARRATLPYFTEVKGVAGRIERGLREDATGAGVPPHVVSELADIFGWELDLSTDLRAGDEFRVLYENIWQTGDTRAEAGRVLGAEIVTDGKPITAVFFEDSDGRGGYYRPTGDALSRDLLRYPLEFTEITSDFSLLRRHPILRRNRPHLGVDFAAPTGTPVRAVASGTISFEGWVNQLGRCVRIDHTGALGSTYGHLERIAAGVRIGSSVERGQVIGYVGATGLATGPHLHFALHRDGEYVDPLAVTAAQERAVPGPARRAFERVQEAVRKQLALLPATMRPRTVSLSDADVHGE
jgi:murein DD-endopeptidase MepM/ murein hydrolase activator NlpD